MTRLTSLLFAATALLATTGCENKEAPDQLTVVQGTVLREGDQRPMSGVLMSIEPYQLGFHGPSFSSAVDSVRTDALGRYQLRFYNRKGAYYAASCDPDYTYRGLGFAPFAENSTSREATVGGNRRRRPLTIGSQNTVNFAPQQMGLVQLRLQLRNTGFQQLLHVITRPLRATALDTTIYRTLPRTSYSVGFGGTFRRLGAGGSVLKDSSATLFILPSFDRDTVQATYRLVR